MYFLLMVMDCEGGDALFVLGETGGLTVVCFWVIFILLAVFLLEVVVGEFYAPDDFVHGAVSLLPLGWSSLHLFVLMNLLLDEFILETANILVESLNYWVDLLQEHSRQLLMVLVVLTNYSDLVLELLGLIEPLQVLAFLMKVDVVLELV